MEQSIRALLGVIILALIILGELGYLYMSSHKTKSTSAPSIPSYEVEKASAHETGFELWLEDISTEESGSKVAIWLHAPQAVQSCKATVRFNPNAMTILDSHPELEGTQIAMGQADRYIMNRIDVSSGEIQIAGDFDEPVQGKVLLGMVALSKSYHADLVTLSIDTAKSSLVTTETTSSITVFGEKELNL